MRPPRLASIAIALAIVCVSCATAPKSARTDVAISLRKAEKSDLGKYGWGTTNPYIPFTSILQAYLPGRVDFVVLVAEIDAPQRSEVQLLGVQADRSELEYYDRARFVEFWDAYGGFEKDIQLRRSRLASSYFPPVAFKVQRGLSKHFVVLVGKYPLKGPWKFRADFLVDGERREVELSLD